MLCHVCLSACFMTKATQRILIKCIGLVNIKTIIKANNASKIRKHSERTCLHTEVHTSTLAVPRVPTELGIYILRTQKL
jgi:hypothetical protein